MRMGVDIEAMRTDNLVKGQAETQEIIGWIIAALGAPIVDVKIGRTRVNDGVHCLPVVIGDRGGRQHLDKVGHGR